MGDMAKSQFLLLFQARRKLLKVDRAVRGVWGHAPRKFWDFRLSEVVSDALSKQQKRRAMLNQKEL